MLSYGFLKSIFFVEVDMIELYGQEDLPAESRVPRYGCYYMDLCAIPQLVTQVKYSVATLLEILEECKHTKRFSGSKKMCIGMGPESQYWDVYLWNPGKVLDIACKYAGLPELHGWQTCDENRWYPWAPASKRFISFIVRQIQRPKGYHYVLADAANITIYNSLPRLDKPYTGHWIGFAVGDPR